jgi:hypothetical protein
MPTYNNYYKLNICNMVVIEGLWVFLGLMSQLLHSICLKAKLCLNKLQYKAVADAIAFWVRFVQDSH